MVEADQAHSNTPLPDALGSHTLTEFNCQHRSVWLFCGSWLACDADNSVNQVHRVDALAGKPAPTFD
ncbi:hypothetical protein C7U57_23405 [Pseudomonas sp. R9.37]|nr:hypothetical protein C7U57_23405 [Pseudomonas sp. R9.37]